GEWGPIALRGGHPAWAHAVGRPAGGTQSPAHALGRGHRRSGARGARHGRSRHWQIALGPRTPRAPRGRAALCRGVALFARCATESATSCGGASAPRAALAPGGSPGSKTAEIGRDARGVWLCPARGGATAGGAAGAAPPRTLPTAHPGAAAATREDPGRL